MKTKEEKSRRQRAREVLDGAVKRYMTENKIDNYSVAFYHFRMSKKGQRLLKKVSEIDELDAKMRKAEQRLEQYEIWKVRNEK